MKNTQLAMLAQLLESSPTKTKSVNRQFKTQRSDRELFNQEPKYTYHALGSSRSSNDLGFVTTILENGKKKTAKVFHIGEQGVMLDDLKTFIAWEQF